jgi:cytochrome c oxidase subunit 2
MSHYKDFSTVNYWIKPVLAATMLLLSTPVFAQSEPTIEIHAKRYGFAPAEITLTKGQPVKLVLIADDVAHSLRIDELHLNVKMPVGQSVETTVTPEEAGDFHGKCGVFCGSGHGQMSLQVHVVGGH